MRIRLPFSVLAVAVLLVAHQLVYLATYGWRGVERALSSVGHDGYWFLIGSTVTLILLVALALSLRRWLSLRAELRLRLRRSGASRRRWRIDWLVFRATFAGLFPRLALAALALFFVQENLEHYLLHGGHMPGLGVVLGPDYVGTLPIFFAVSLVVAIVTALLQLGFAALARLVDQAARRRAEPDVPRPAGRLLPIHSRSRSTPGLGRAPPALA